MADKNKIGLQAIFESEEFQQGIAAYNAAIDASEKATQQGASSMGSAWEGLSAIGGVAWGVVAGAVAAATAEMYLAIDAAFQTENVMAELQFQIEKTGDATGITEEQVLGLADSLSKVLPIDDEVITQAITMGMRFDGVNKDNIQPLIKAAADLAVSTGTALPAAMRSLALSISDPDKAARLFREANITLTDAQRDQLKTWKDQGDQASITGFILDQVNKKVGGLAETMGTTASGKAALMQTAIGNLQETLGGPFLDALKDSFDRITVFANDPKTIAFFQQLGTVVGQVASTIVDSLPDIMVTVEFIVSWLQENQPLIVGILAVITAAMLAFAASAVIAFIATAEVSVPLVAAIALIGAVSAILFKAWTENWGGIQEKVMKTWVKIKPVFDKIHAWVRVNMPKAIKILTDFWEDVLLPAIVDVVGWMADNLLPMLSDLVVWLGDNVPKALKTLSVFWTGTLLPAITAVHKFISGTLIPIFTTLVTWLATTLTNALKTLSAIWTGILLPAITAVWSFISSYIIPLFNAITSLMNAVLGVALKVLAGIWQNILLPALQTVWSFIANSLNPVFTAIGSIINNVVRPAIEALGNWLKNTAISLFTPFYNWLQNSFLGAWNGIKNAIQFVIDRIRELVTALNNLTLPDWLTPGSPTPWEMGLRGINEQLKNLANASLPALQHQMNILATVRDARVGSSGANSTSISNSNQNTHNYLYGAQFNIPGPSGVIQTLQGLS